MGTRTMMQTSRKLPSVDVIALVIGVIGFMLGRLSGPSTMVWPGLMGLVVFGPPMLRELGLLKDDDEFARNIRWRAGFHTVLALALFVFLNRVLFPLLRSSPDAVWGETWIFPNDFLRQNMVLVFLLSYLIQYWGASRGVFRILLGFAGLTLIEGMMATLNWNEGQNPAYLLISGMVLVLIAIAFLARSQPKWGGWLLVVVGVAIISATIVIRVNQDFSGITQLDMTLASIKTSVSVFLIFVVTGVSLLKSGDFGLE